MGTRERRGRSYSADAHLASLFGDALLQIPSRDSLALAAVGGYGRGELSPGSDLDLLFLHNGNIPFSDLTKAVEKILYPLWDSGFSVDHSVRTRSEVKEIADTDGRVALGLLDIRWVAGNRDLVDTVESVALMDWRKNGARWISELRKFSQERAQRSGELAYLLEPDLKASLALFKVDSAFVIRSNSTVTKSVLAIPRKAVISLKPPRDSFRSGSSR